MSSATTPGANSRGLNRAAAAANEASHAGASPSTTRSSGRHHPSRSDPSRRKRSFGSATASPLSSSAVVAAADNPRKQKKASRACDFCKTKKLRCSGTLPCSGCTKRKLTCVYDAQYRRGRPPTPPSLVAFPPDPRVCDATSSSSRLSDHSAASQGAPRGEEVEDEEEQGDADIREQSMVAEGKETQNTTSRASPDLESAEIEGQYVDPTSSLTFLHRAWKRLSSSQGDNPTEMPRHTSTQDHDQQPLVAAGDRPFAYDASIAFIPGQAEAMDMLRYYFEVCVITYRCLHRASVSEWFRVVLANSSSHAPLHHSIGHAKASIVLAILAIASLRVHRIDEAGSPAVLGGQSLRRSDTYFTMSKALTDAEVGFPQLESAQARVMQVLYLLQSARMNQAWFVFGSTLPIISALGLHRKSRKHISVTERGRAGSPNYIHQQCRKRTFWVAYTIDKYLAVVFGRPRLYHSDDIDQDFPDRVNDEDMTSKGLAAGEPAMDCHLDSLIYHARLAQLIDHISRDVYTLKSVPKQERLARARKHGQALHQWRESLPHHLGTVRPSTLIPQFRRQATAMKLAYCHAVMHANRPFILGATGDTSPGSVTTPLEDCVEECIGAARTALQIVDGMADDGTLFYAFWWTPYVTFCALAVVYVWEIQHPLHLRTAQPGTLERPVNIDDLLELAERCQTHLTNVTAPDSPGRRYSIILEELRKEAKSQSARIAARHGFEYNGITAPDASTTNVVSADGTIAHSDANLQSSIALSPRLQPQLISSDQGTTLNSSFGNDTFLGVDLLSSWETVDWLELDSSAFGPFPEVDEAFAPWMPNEA